MASAWILRPLPLAAVTASATAAGYDPAYVANDYLGVVWRSPSVANPYLSLDLGADAAVDTALLLGCTGAAAGWALNIKAATAAQGSGFGAGSYDATQDFLAGSAMLPSGRGVALWAPSPAPALTRYMRLTAQQGSTSPVTVGRVAVGKRIALSRNFAFGAAFGVRDLGAVDFSPLGVLQRRYGAKLRTIGLTFSSVYKDEVEAAIQPLIEQVGTTDPIGLVVDPAPHAQRQRRIYFGFLLGEQGTVRRNAVAYEWRANLVSLV